MNCLIEADALDEETRWSSLFGGEVGGRRRAKEGEGRKEGAKKKWGYFMW